MGIGDIKISSAQGIRDEKLASLHVVEIDISMEPQYKCLQSFRSLADYYSCSGNLAEIHGQFTNSVSTTCKTKKESDKLTSLYDLDLFSLKNLRS